MKYRGNDFSPRLILNRVARIRASESKTQTEGLIGRGGEKAKHSLQDWGQSTMAASSMASSDDHAAHAEAHLAQLRRHSSVFFKHKVCRSLICKRTCLDE